MRSKHNSIYRLLDTSYHENFDVYSPSKADFHDLISSKLPHGWEMGRHQIWFHCGPAGSILPEQGWKIHVSAPRANAKEILRRVSSILFAAGNSHFKFALDSNILSLLNSKNWPRASSGKFITIYPKDNRHFLELIEELYMATREFRGPYILSDHRYKDSHAVFYRYGGMRLCQTLDITGEKIPVLFTPDGDEVPDTRAAYPATPTWAEAILPDEEFCETSECSNCLHNGRFRVESVIDFSNAGGIYRGIDQQTCASVIIKEARPFIEMPDNNDAVGLLKKEYRLLSVLADTGIAPQPIELFEEQTHWFLVEERVNGVPLSADSAAHNILLRTRPAENDFEEWYQKFRQLALRLVEIMRILHSRNIVFADLSTNNLIVTDGTRDLKLIDFEGAFELGIDQPASIYTPGFVSQKRVKGAAPSIEDDYYSLGAVLMAYLMPVNGFFHLKPQAKEEFIRSILRDAHLPAAAGEMILGLMDPQSEDSGSLTRIAETLPPVCSAPAPEQPAGPAEDYSQMLEDIVQHMLKAATYTRSDRLFPADPKIFTTNPLSLAYGATGIAYAIKKITGTVPKEISDWILKQRVASESYTPGLYVGLSGIAWALLEMGECEHAEKLFRLTFGHRLLDRFHDLFYGSAGWGMANLRFYLATADELYLDNAVRCGDRLLGDSCMSRSQNISEAVNRPLGLGHGDSGVALYLLYLHLATNERRFLAKGRELLDAELAAGIETKDGGLSWGMTSNSQNIVFPYWRYGSAGIGTAVLRYNRVLGDGAYGETLEKIFIDTDRKYAVFPGRFKGLGGLGDFLLDAWIFTGEQKYRDGAHKVGQGLMKFSVNRGGTAFPGDSLSRLSCDYGTGSAGIALFLNRLMGKQDPDFLLDDLLGLTGEDKQNAIASPSQQVSEQVA
ncbi:MAG TPA: class III lanthionine synthetase LanKC [Candidatus Angelobacter sp.]